ncbi:protein Shroom2 [Trichomycterus rosablanca]|uniref:protein Shroom2 n=1 Tax=Trichomycterus rosablanca TaxID=2290929 RepID=UPI002F3578F3
MYEMDPDQNMIVLDRRSAGEPDRSSGSGPSGSSGSGPSGDGWRLVSLALCGGAPWGFTLRGGLEHGEPLIITKVEEGSKAALVRLQVGDELININEVPLSGYRQEAICLVKGSHRTLTLVVKRKNEPVSRPHSWHSTKFNESQTDPVKTQCAPSQAWQTRYDASTFSSDLGTAWDQTNLLRASDQFSSLGSMDSLEQGAYPYPPGRLSPSKSNGNSVEQLGVGKRDSAYSSFSTSSGTPDYTLSRSNTASTENVLYKVNQWSTSAGRHAQNPSDAGRQDERVAHPHHASGTGGRESPRSEEQPGYRNSSSGRSSFTPVWHVPESRRSTAPSPPPPVPPVRVDSFAATKIHHPEGPGTKLQARVGEKVAEFSERSYHASDQIHEAGPNVLKSGSGRTYFPSGADVTAGHPAHARHPYHQRQYSDESTFYAPAPRNPPAPRSQNANFSGSMQDLPSNSHHAQGYAQNQIRRTVAPLSGAPADPNPDGQSSSRYYCAKSRQSSQGSAQSSSARLEDRGANLGAEMMPTGTGSDRNSVSSQGSNGHHSQHRIYPAFGKTSSSFDESTAKVLEIRGIQKQDLVTNSTPSFTSYPPSKPPEQARIRSREPSQEHFLSQTEVTICPRKTPMLHSLSQDGTRLLEDRGDPFSGNKPQEPADSQDARQAHRPERFATALRNEIQMRRAQLQKSRSAAALCESGDPDEQPPARKPADHAPPPSDGSFTDTYKDHLKEAQARVLKATSFRRRDLEPVLPEHPGPDALSVSRKDGAGLASVSEAPASGPASGANHVARIGGRKRIPAEKKVRSYSEPEKIHDLGVAEDGGVSLASRRRVFEATGRPAFCKPVPKQDPQTPEDSGFPKTGPGGSPKRDAGTKAPDAPGSSQRLGTFAEYEATWNTQRKAAEARAPGRFHSADNILDSGVEERRKPSYFHERSRSSPSDDFYGQNVPVQGRTSADQPPPERELGAHGSTAGSRISDGGRKDSAPSPLTERDPVPTRSPPNAAGPPHLVAEPSQRPPPPPHPDDPVTDAASVSLNEREEPGADAMPVSSDPPAHLTPPAVEDQRAPSPHFAPQRLTDKPPLSLVQQDEASGGMDKLTDDSSAVKKVPIRIVHSETDTEDDRQYLRLNSGAPLASPGAPLAPLSALGGPDESPSPFCPYTPRHRAPGADRRTDGVPSLAEDELTRDIIDRDKSLADILDQSKRMTTMDLMEGIFPQGEQLVEEAHQRRRATPKPSASRGTEERREEDTAAAAAAALVTSSAYYSTSAPKAELLIKMKDMQEQSVDLESEEELEEENDTELANKKHELIDSLSKKLQVLREARESLQQDVQDNNALGDEVEVTVQAVCKPNELEKFRMFVGDLDKVVSLLLSLSGRLARVENALNSLEEDAPDEERRTLVDKRKLLIRQHEDAKELKENLDRRERAVYDILTSYLREDSMADYEHFVKMKSALIIEQRKLEDKIKLGDEQLKCLLDSLPLEQRPRY